MTKMTHVNLMKKISPGFAFGLLFILLVLFEGVEAEDRYDHDSGQLIWNSVSGMPSVNVFIKGSSVYARVMGTAKPAGKGSRSKMTNSKSVSTRIDLPAIRLKKINGKLLDEYHREYIRIQDFDRDGKMDIGVLKSAGYGGGLRCYSVFEYQPFFYSYHPHATKTICIE